MVQTKSRPELPLYRLYVLRASYLLLGLAQGSRTWPAILHHAQPWDFWQGVGMSFFGALTLLSLLGVRYPVRMMPLLIFECIFPQERDHFSLEIRVGERPCDFSSLACRNLRRVLRLNANGPW
jgi:hypothetical protein